MLKVKLFADTSVRSEIDKYAEIVSGFTTNPSLMKKAGVLDYQAFAMGVIEQYSNHSLSLEVFADDFKEMERQARKIASWGSNVFVKIPVTNTLGEPSAQLVRHLLKDGIKVNVTAILMLAQAVHIFDEIDDLATQCYVSIFAGRLADTGMDPCNTMKEATRLAKLNVPNVEILWASTRELFNVIQADMLGVHIITLTPDLLIKLPLLGKNPFDYSLDTVKMFRQDALSADYQL
jgi:transaldolase